MNASVAILVSLTVGLLPSLAAQQPTWPLLIDSFPRLDTTRRVQLLSGRWLYRANITLRFKESVSDSAKREFFSRHRMTVVGVTRSGRFFVNIPDPGPTLDSLMGRLQLLRTEPEIRPSRFGTPDQLGPRRFSVPSPVCYMRRTPVSRTRYARLFATPRRGKNGGGASPRTICRRSPYHRSIFTGRWWFLLDSELSGARATR